MLLAIPGTEIYPHASAPLNFTHTSELYEFLPSTVAALVFPERKNRVVIYVANETRHYGYLRFLNSDQNFENSPASTSEHHIKIPPTAALAIANPVSTQAFSIVASGDGGEQNMYVWEGWREY